MACTGALMRSPTVTRYWLRHVRAFRRPDVAMRGFCWTCFSITVRHWQDYAAEPLAQFSGRVYQVLLQEPQLPERLARIAPRMAEQDWLGSYRDFAVLQQVLVGMQRRLSRPQGLDGALEELERLYDPLLADFREFYPQLQAFAAARRGMA